jgi:hypothetical protein
VILLAHGRLLQELERLFQPPKGGIYRSHESNVAKHQLRLKGPA